MTFTARAGRGATRAREGPDRSIELGARVPCLPRGPGAEPVLGIAAHAITRHRTVTGEADLGRLVAEAAREATGSDFAFVNDGALRADLAAGAITRSGLERALPWANLLVSMRLKGECIYDLLEEQWRDPLRPRLLDIVGLGYTWDARSPAERRVRAVTRDGLPIDLRSEYVVAVNGFLALGGDGFSTFCRGGSRQRGPSEVDAIASWILRQTQPFSATWEKNVTRLV